MSRLFGYGRQTGATLIVGMIMLLLFTLMVSSAFMMSSTNLKAVGNVQSRSEAIAAANKAIEYMLSTPFASSPAAAQVSFDLDNNGTTDYTASVARPECIQASESPVNAPSSVTLPAMSNSPWNTVWELRATVTDAVSGAATVVRSGARVLLTQAEKNSVCP